jgi:predicted SnoaL-like aldol condensation-catalyzing enzyme
MKTNKEIVREFTQAIFNEGRFERLLEFMHEDYIQHSMEVEQGREGFLAFAKSFRSAYPDLELRIKHLYEDGDTVISFNHAVLEPGQTEAVVVDIYRLEDGMLKEHWDCKEPLSDEGRGKIAKLF